MQVQAKKKKTALYDAIPSQPEPKLCGVTPGNPVGESPCQEMSLNQVSCQDATKHSHYHKLEEENKYLKSKKLMSKTEGCMHRVIGLDRHLTSKAHGMLETEKNLLLKFAKHNHNLK